jgi:hypothetical protein
MALGIVAVAVASGTVWILATLYHLLIQLLLASG